MLSSEQTIRVGGLAYHLSSDSFLSEPQARYALQRLWELSGGDPEYSGPVLIAIVAASVDEVNRCMAPRARRSEARSVRSLLPAGSKLTYCFDDLPMILPVRSSFAGPESNGFPVDLAAFAFLMLTRWEEHQSEFELDHHDRASRTAMLAYREGFAQRPIIDQWALVLRQWISHRCGAAVGPLPRPTVRMTHDVDRPLRFTRFARVLRGCAGELIARSHSPIRACREFSLGLRSLKNYRLDPFYQEICRFMRWSEQFGMRGSFYLMSSAASPYDDGYDGSRGAFAEIIKEVRNRGHELGWHPGYFSSVERATFAAEFERICQLIGEIPEGGRQHYLRWKAGQSWEAWEDAGLTYDSSLGFADAIGFRCGTARPYPVYSLTRDAPLQLIERPLAIMDCALEIECPQPQVARWRVAELLRMVGEVGGEAVLLMHNSFTNLDTLNAMTAGTSDFLLSISGVGKQQVA